MNEYASQVVRQSDRTFAGATSSEVFFREVSARLLGESAVATDHVLMQRLHRKGEAGGVRWRFRQGQHALLYFKGSINAFDGRLDGKEFTRSFDFKDRLCFVPAGSEIDGSVRIEGEYSYFVALINDSLIGSDTEIAQSLRSAPPHFGFSDSQIADGVSRLENELLNSDEVSRLILEGWAIQLLGLLYRRIARIGLDRDTERSGLSRQVLGRVVECLRERIAEDAPLSDLAAIAGLSNRHFLRQFYRATGTTPGRMQLELRMERAASLLLNPSLSVTEIAFQCGFSQPQHFATAFRRRYGATPTEYRKRQ